MATLTQSSDLTPETSESGPQENDPREQQGTDETSDQPTEKQGEPQPQEKISKPAKHDPAKQALLADLYKERKEARTAKARLAELEGQITELTSKSETVDAVQAKYDRLEAFLQGLPGPVGQALDSRSFTHALFETDKEISEIVKEWNAKNPSATSAALGRGSAVSGDNSPTMNDLLRAAMK